MISGPALRRLTYYVTVVVGGVAFHQSGFADLAGGEVTDFLRRNSEAYALMVLVPAFWDLFAWRAEPRARTGARRRAAGRRLGASQAVWFGALGLGAVATQTSLLERVGVDLPQSLVTLGEAFVAAIVISWYFEWSRDLSGAIAPAGGSPVVSGRQRALYYAGLTVVAAIAHQSFVASAAGDAVGDWFRLNAEALGAALIIPLYFDVVAAAGRAVGTRVLWYGSLLVVPLLAQSGALDGAALGGLAEWLTKITEAFIAAIGITFYFDVWRGPGEHGGDPH